MKVFYRWGKIINIWPSCSKFLQFLIKTQHTKNHNITVSLNCIVQALRIPFILKSTTRTWGLRVFGLFYSIKTTKPTQTKNTIKQKHRTNNTKPETKLKWQNGPWTFCIHSFFFLNPDENNEKKERLLYF